VGRIEPLGTTFQSATTERNGNITAATNTIGRNHSRQIRIKLAV
jgi:hypothetical protein